MNVMDQIFQRMVENQFSELEGLTVDASIPVPESLLNEIIQSELAGNKKVSALHIRINRDNRLVVDVKSPLWPWPLSLKLQLFGSVDLTPSPKVRAFLENNVLMGKLGSLLKALPEGITLYQDQISVDLGIFVKSPEQKKLLELVRKAEIQTEEGRLILNINVAT